MIRLGCFCFLLIGFVALSAQDTSIDAFNQANTFFEEGNYKKAQKAYSAIVSEGNANYQTHYNLSISYFKTKELSKALLHAEKAKNLKPREKAVNHNLNYFRKQREQTIDNTAYSFINTSWDNIAGKYKSNFWAFATIFFIWLFGLGILSFMIAENGLLKRAGFFIGIIVLGLGIATHFLGRHSKVMESGSGAAIFMDSNEALKAKPRNESEDLLIIHNGEKLFIKSQVNEWYKVKLLNGQQGWIHQDKIELI